MSGEQPGFAFHRPDALPYLDFVVITVKATANSVITKHRKSWLRMVSRLLCFISSLTYFVPYRGPVLDPNLDRHRESYESWKDRISLPTPRIIVPLMFMFKSCSRIGTKLCLNRQISILFHRRNLKIDAR
jgi:hypothetical protein